MVGKGANYENLLLEREDGIGVIILNRPEQLNTFNSALAAELNQALEELEGEEDIRVIVVKGEGKAFSAGIDINELKGKSPSQYLEWADLMEKMCHTIASMGKPVIASVQDLAIANGIGLVAAADLAVAAEGARFGATAVKVGLFCMGPAVPLYRHMGKKKALELLLTGELIEAEEAERIGLINKVTPKENLEEETMNLAANLAAKSPLALQWGKKSFYAMSDLTYEKALEATNHHFALLCSTEDAHEGVDAFLQKRDPQWKMK